VDFRLGAIALLIPAVAGFFLWRRLHTRSSGLEALAYALPLGVVAVAVEMVASSLLYGGYTLAILLVPLLLVGVACAVSWRRPIEPAPEDRPAPPGWVGRAALVILAAEVGLVLAELGASPTLTDWDGWAIWGLKAKAFFIDGSLRTYFDRTNVYEFSWPGRPCLSSMLQAFVYTGLGRVDEAAARLAHVALWMSLLLMFYVNLRLRCGIDSSLVWTAALATVPNLTYQASAGVANPILGLYLFAALAAADRWEAQPGRGPLAAAGLLLAGATLSRDEGLLLGTATVAAVFTIRRPGALRGRERLRAAGGLCLAGGAAYGLWHLLLVSSPVPPVGIQTLWSAGPDLPLRLLDRRGDVPAILAAIGGELVRTSEQTRSSPLEEFLGIALLWPLFAAACLSLRRLRQTDPMGLRCLVTTWAGLLFYTGAFLVFPYESLEDVLHNWVFVMDRHAIALAPMALRVMASAFGRASETPAR